MCCRASHSRYAEEVEERLVAVEQLRASVNRLEKSLHSVSAGSRPATPLHLPLSPAHTPSPYAHVSNMEGLLPKSTAGEAVPLMVNILAKEEAASSHAKQSRHPASSLTVSKHDHDAAAPPSGKTDLAQWSEGAAPRGMSFDSSLQGTASIQAALAVDCIPAFRPSNPEADSLDLPADHCHEIASGNFEGPLRSIGSYGQDKHLDSESLVPASIAQPAEEHPASSHDLYPPSKLESPHQHGHGSSASNKRSEKLQSAHSSNALDRLPSGLLPGEVPLVGGQNDSKALVKRPFATLQHTATIPQPGTSSVLSGETSQAEETTGGARAPLMPGQVENTDTSVRQPAAGDHVEGVAAKDLLAQAGSMMQRSSLDVTLQDSSSIASHPLAQGESARSNANAVALSSYSVHEAIIAREGVVVLPALRLLYLES